MGYVFTHIFECLLLAGLLGGLIGWLMRGSGFSQKFADLEAEWGRKLGLANDETAAALAKVKAAETEGSGWKTKFVAMDGDYSKLKTSFSDVSAKVPALETAIAGWTAKSAAWDADKAKLTADLAACADARGKLETELKGWATKSAAWDTQRADMTAKLTAGAGSDAKVKELTAQLATAAGAAALVTKLQGSQTALEADKAALAAQLKKVQAEHDHAVNVYKLAIENEKKLAATAAKVNPEHEALVADLRAKHAKLQAEHDHAVNVYKLAIANEKTLTADHTAFIAKAHSDYADLEARFKALQAEHAKAMTTDQTSISQHDAVIAELRSSITVLETRLHEMQLERDQALGRVNRSLADVDGLHVTITDLRNRLSAFESERSTWTTERTSWLAERSEWARKYSALEARWSEAAPAAKAAAASSTGSSTVVTSVTPSNFVGHAHREGDIEIIQGIGAYYGEKLRTVGIAWVKDLLEMGSTPDGRKLIEERTGITHTLVLKWVNQADLMRVSGVTPNFAELLEASGVDTVKELRHRVPANLAAKLKETRLSQTYKVDVPVPDEAMVGRWIEIAKTLTPKVTY